MNMHIDASVHIFFLSLLIMHTHKPYIPKICEYNHLNMEKWENYVSAIIIIIIIEEL